MESERAPSELSPSKRARTRQRLLDSAEQLFAERGVGSATVEDIAKQAGVSVGAVYKHFPNRAALEFALIDDALTALEATLDLAHAHSSPIERVHAAGRGYFTLAARRPVVQRLATARIVSIDPGSTDEASRAFEGRTRALMLRVARDLREAMDAGEVQRLPVDEALVFLWGAWSGVAQLTVRSDGLAIPEPLADRALQLGAQLFAAGAPPVISRPEPATT